MKKITLLLTLLFVFVLSSAIGQITYSGPYSGSSASPTPLVLGVGTNTISSTVTTSGPSISQWFDLTLPAAMEITNVTLGVTDPASVSSGTMCWNPFSTCNPSDSWTPPGQPATPITAWDFPGTLPIASSPGVISVDNGTAFNTTWTLVVTVAALACTDPTIPVLSATPSSVCPGGAVTLSLTGTLNDATNWQWYTGSCGGTSIGSGTSLVVNPVTTTTYYARGEGGCVVPGACGTVDVTVFTPPTVTFTALADLCIDAGVQAGLGGGSPSGGVYSGAGVTDDGNGMTYSFDPAAAGAGVHTLTYTFTDANGCSASDSDDVEVFALPTVTFTALADLCIDAGVQAGLGGGSPSGGVYSGAGVTDDGNGMTYSFDPAAAGVGVHTLTYTFTDANGCTGSDSDDVEVFALPTVTFTAPADLCIDAGVQAGLGGGSPSGGVYSGAGVTDDGNGMTYSFDPAAAGVGVHTLTYTFTDANGCTGSDSDDVEVFALPTVTFTAPADLCIDAGVQAGLGGGTPSGGVYSGPGVTDDGNGMTYSFDPAAAGVGVHTLTYTFTDANGCTGSDSDDVEVFALPTVTFTAPADLCIDAGVQAGLGGGTPSGGVYSGPGVTDDGNGMTYSFDPAAAGVGVHTLTYTFTDANGCTGSDSDDVEVFALPTVTFTAPADLCIDAGVQAGLGGGTPSGGVYSGPGVTDDGNGMTYSFDPAAAGVGVHTLTYTFTDANGCTASDSDDVEVFALPTVTFTAPPSPVCPGDVLIAQGGGSPTGGVYSGPGVTDDGNGMTYTFDAGASGNGTHILTYTYTDANGCTNSDSDSVTVEDTEDPVITCAADGTRDTDSGVCTYTVQGTEFDATFTDNCTSGVIFNNYNSTDTMAGVVLPKGVTTVIWTVNDGNGQTATCTTVITVEDNEDPVISCAADGTRDTDPGVCEYTVVGTEFDATFTDNCPDGSIINDFNSTDTMAGEVLAPGVYSIIWTVDDGNGQTASCTTVITIEDNEVPVIACPADVAVNTNPGQCYSIVTFPDAIAFDNCGVASVVQTAGLPSGSQFPVGVSTIEYTATDIHGNTSVCSFTITVTDNEAPMAVCMDITIQLDEFGDASIVAADVDGGSTDNCGIATMTIDVDTFDCSDVGDNPVVLTVTDVNGNVSSCTAIVTVEDVTDPVAVCMDITVQLDPTGTVTILGSDIGGASTDACGIASYDLDIDTFTCADVGDNPVVLTVTDVNGNVSTCTAVVTVEDNTSPDLVCMDITLELGADGTATIVPEDVIATNDDACGVLTIAVDIFEFDCSDIGTPVTVQVFSQDVNGNLSTCTAVVTVVDLLAPVLTCPADQTVDPGAGNLFYEVPDYFALGEATATDNCTDPVVITSQDPAAGTLLPDGTYTVTITAEDEYGNVATCTFELTVDTILGIGDTTADISSIVLYPNPATDYVMLSNPNNVELQSVAIYDLTGRLIKTIDLVNMDAEKTIDVSELASSTYMFVIKGTDSQMTKQLIKE
ncbi:HYR domain-containing protein [Ulvibacter sp. MAR_2010_11]|uniref:HYR domain-containing protein n=1 Tax=Ulvibacter sp. MAR_2010_11 TaxID=1250229 RepID=UPI0018E28655|nr:HYR domain-containing protein [Ulvibacter sp. MAR_2010_11]